MFSKFFQSSATTSPTTPEIILTNAAIPAKQSKTNVEQVYQSLTNLNQSDLNPIGMEEDIDMIHMKHTYSPSTVKVFYYMSKLFGYNAGSSSEFCNQFFNWF